jgi:hypothetical protein
MSAAEVCPAVMPPSGERASLVPAFDMFATTLAGSAVIVIAGTTPECKLPVAAVLPVKASLCEIGRTAATIPPGAVPTVGWRAVVAGAPVPAVTRTRTVPIIVRPVVARAGLGATPFGTSQFPAAVFVGRFFFSGELRSQR